MILGQLRGGDLEVRVVFSRIFVLDVQPLLGTSESCGQPCCVCAVVIGVIEQLLSCLEDEPGGVHDRLYH